jgi:hypothetical protein
MPQVARDPAEERIDELILSVMAFGSAGNREEERVELRPPVRRAGDVTRLIR